MTLNARRYSNSSMKRLRREIFRNNRNHGDIESAVCERMNAIMSEGLDLPSEDASPNKVYP